MVNEDLSLSFGYTVEELASVFDKYRYALGTLVLSKSDTWKSPCIMVHVTEEDKAKLIAAIKFYLADEPTIYPRRDGYYDIETKGYQAW